MESGSRRMKMMLAGLVLSTNAMAVTVPNFECTEIHGMHIVMTNDMGHFDQSQPVGYGSFVYEIRENVEANIVNAKNNDGYYYGNVYLDKTGNYYYDIRCKIIP